MLVELATAGLGRTRIPSHPNDIGAGLRRRVHVVVIAKGRSFVIFQQNIGEEESMVLFDFREH